MLKKQTLIQTALLLSFFLVASLIALAAEPDASGPGVAYSDRQAGDARPGSLLIYNFYTSDPANAGHDTQLNITNTSTLATAVVHLFFIDGASCATADTFICLTPNQTASFLASDVDPGTTGYLIAYAVNRATGCPIQFNHLIGSEFVKTSNGHTANLPAEAVAALADDAKLGCRSNSTEAVLNFNDRDYARLPRQLALDSIPSAGNGNSTLLVVNSINGGLITSVTRIGDIFGILFDDAEVAFSFRRANNSCQLRQVLSNAFPATVPSFTTAIPTGRTGWLKLFATRNLALTGAAITFNPNSSTIRRAFNGGHNLHHLSAVDHATLTVPIFPPSC